MSRLPRIDGRATGRLVLVVGPSGAGKDSLIRHARHEFAGDPTLVFPRRIVTRPPSESEDNIEVHPARFAELCATGAFFVSWEAHGLRYAVLSQVADDLVAGRQVICNVSRTVVREIRARHARVLVIGVTASAEVLARRLAARGRVADGAMDQRLARSAQLLTSEPADLTILNEGSLEAACRAFSEALRPTALRPSAEDSRATTP